MTDQHILPIQTQKVFITKYVFSSGIIEMDAELKEAKGFKKNTYAYGKITSNAYPQGFYNEDFHLTKEEAIVDAEKRRIKKIAMLKKQIAALEKIAF